MGRRDVWQGEKWRGGGYTVVHLQLFPSKMNIYLCISVHIHTYLTLPYISSVIITFLLIHVPYIQLDLNALTYSFINSHAQ